MCVDVHSLPDKRLCGCALLVYHRLEADALTSKNRPRKGHTLRKENRHWPPSALICLH